MKQIHIFYRGLRAAPLTRPQDPEIYDTSRVSIWPRRWPYVCASIVLVLFFVAVTAGGEEYDRIWKGDIDKKGNDDSWIYYKGKTIVKIEQERNGNGKTEQWD